MNIMPTTAARPLILNVDQDPTNRSVKTRSLRAAEMEVIEAETGAAALKLIANCRPSLVLLDVNLSGWDICRRIKADCPDTVIIHISARAITSADQLAALQNQADCALTAPVQPVELNAVICAMLRLRDANTQSWEAGERYRVIVESAVDCAILTCGVDSRVTSWNPGAQAMFGYAPEDIVGESWACVFMADDVVAGVHTAEMLAAHAGTHVHADRWHRHRDGRRVWSSGRLLALRDRRGEVASYLKIIHDRSVEREARDALNLELETRVAERTRALTEANDQLRAEIQERDRAGEQLGQLQKMESLGQLTGGIAHDFNNLLTAILGGLEVTRRRIDDPRSVRLIDSSISAAQRGARLIAQLMAFARKQNLQVAYLALNPLMRDMRDQMEHTVGKSASLVCDLADDLWPVMADANRLRSALLNLVTNASDAMPDGGTLRIGSYNTCVTLAEADLPAGDYATLFVQDNGTGMTEAVRARVFEPFFTTKEVGKGSGLGLAQVYGFVRQSGGTVRMCSEVGGGTTITILLPRTSAADPG